MSEFVIRWEVDEVGKLTDKDRISPIEHHSGLPWSLSVRKHTANGPVDHFSLFLNCNDDSIYDFWSCEHTSTLVVVNRNDEAATVKHELNTKFNKATDNLGKRDLVHFIDVLDIQKGFILDDKVLVEARITVKAVNGIKKVTQYDFSKEGLDTAALSIAGEKVHVSKGFLATESPFFADLFYKKNDDKDKEEDKENDENKENNGQENDKKEIDHGKKEQAEIELKDVSVQDFTELLLATYPSHKAITVDSYKSILSLAERFQVQSAMDRAEAYLIKTKKVSVSAKLLLSEKYKLELLQLHSLHTLETLQAVKALEKTDEYKELSADFKMSILSRIFRLVE